MTYPLLASGRDADVFALGEHTVLRRYRDGSDASREAELMRYVAAHAYPVPTVHSAAGADLVMERLDGPTMLHAVESGRLDAREAGQTLADLHERLHRIPGRSAGTDGLRVVHLDLHPENVMLLARGPVVIDWRNARDGDPALDVALSAVILAQVAADPTEARAGIAATVLAAFADESHVDPALRLDDALAFRAADANISPAERGRLQTAGALVRSGG